MAEEFDLRVSQGLLTVERRGKDSERNVNKSTAKKRITERIKSAFAYLSKLKYLSGHE